MSAQTESWCGSGPGRAPRGGDTSPATFAFLFNILGHFASNPSVPPHETPDSGPLFDLRLVIARTQEIDKHIIEIIEEPVMHTLSSRRIGLVAADQRVR